MDKPLSFFATALKVLIKDVERTQKSLRTLQNRTAGLQKSVRAANSRGQKGTKAPR